MICRKVVRQVYYLLQVLLGVGSAGTPSPTPGIAYIPTHVHLCVYPSACLPLFVSVCGSIRSVLHVELLHIHHKESGHACYLQIAVAISFPFQQASAIVSCYANSINK